MTARRDKTAPAPSATVVLLRAAGEAPEVLLVRRHARSSFGATYVFPGGVLEPGDRRAHRHCRGRDAAAADACLGLRRDGLDYYSAAIRELFEETGVLLAHGPGGNRAGNGIPAVELRAERRRLNAGDASWPDVLAKHGWSLACERLCYFAHWITPVAHERRFTTRFFAAELPRGQQASHDGGELTDSRWLRPTAALRADRDDRLALPPPTRATLEDLSNFASVAAAMDWARHRETVGVEAWLPVIAGPAGSERVLMPGEPGYPGAGGDRGDEPA